MIIKSKEPDQTIRLENGNFKVTSGASGKSYIVTIKSKIDNCGSMYFTRECSCPARKHCHHLDSVEQFQWDEANEYYSKTDKGFIIIKIELFIVTYSLLPFSRWFPRPSGFFSYN